MTIAISNKEIKFGQEARKAMLEGAKELAMAVRCTLGPGGRVVVINKFDRTTPIVTKDGVSVAEQIAYADQFKDVGAQLIKSVASRAGEEIGDGTTTSTVLAGSIIEQGIAAVNDGANPVWVRDGIQWAANVAIEAISTRVSKLDDEMIKYIATISANNEKALGQNVANAFKEAGNNGLIIINEEEVAKGEDIINIPKGSYFKNGYETPYLLKEGRVSFKTSETVVLVCGFKFSEENFASEEAFVELISKMCSLGKPVWIVAPEFSSPVLSSIVHLSHNHPMGIMCTKTPGFGARQKAMAEDLAKLTGGKVLHAVNDFNAKYVGGVKSLEVTHDRSLFTLDLSVADGEELDNHIFLVSELLKEQTQNHADEFDIAVTRDRLAMLDGKVVEITVGGYSEGAHRERKDRYDDAIKAVRAAQLYGYLPGGCVPHLYGQKAISDKLRVLTHSNPDFLIGVNIMQDSLSVPFEVLSMNTGKDLTETLEIKRRIVQDFNQGLLNGYDFKNGQYGSLIDMGVVDPAQTALSSIRIASELGGLFLSTETVIVEDKQNKEGLF